MIPTTQIEEAITSEFGNQYKIKSNHFIGEQRAWRGSEISFLILFEPKEMMVEANSANIHEKPEAGPEETPPSVTLIPTLDKSLVNPKTVHLL